MFLLKVLKVLSFAYVRFLLGGTFPTQSDGGHSHSHQQADWPLGQVIHSRCVCRITPRVFQTIQPCPEPEADPLQTCKGHADVVSDCETPLPYFETVQVRSPVGAWGYSKAIGRVEPLFFPVV